MVTKLITLIKLAALILSSGSALPQYPPVGFPSSSFDPAASFETGMPHSEELPLPFNVGPFPNNDVPFPAAFFPGGHHSENHDHFTPANYAFEYDVHDPHTGDVKSQHETRKGDEVTGYYSLKEADGTIREVHYTADKHNGFNAIVKKTGQALHPGHQVSAEEP